ncbi:MAG: ABC transporter permease, partial [Nitrospirae bacterium]|nr:ABC transporter permease [Nitrospirota bacterium]
MLGRIRGMLIKEFIQVFRDKRSRFVLFGPPVIQMLVFGYAATLDIRHVPTAVLDYDNSQVSRDLLSRFTASPYFDVRARLEDHRQIGELIDRGDVIMALQINAGFAEDLRKGQTAHLQVIVDSSNSNTALIAVGYVNQVASRFSEDYQTERLRRTSPLLLPQMPRVVLEHRPWFNTDLQSQWFFVPGIIGNLVLVMVVTLT